MNNTPTPRTDERKASFALDTIRQLETELAAVTEQLKAEQENLTKSCMRERLADEDRKYVENQRDDAFFQLAEAQEKLAAMNEHQYNKSMTGTLTTVWESYERNGDLCAAFKTKEQAENHDLYEVGFVSEAQIYLSEEGIKELNEGKAIW